MEVMALRDSSINRYQFKAQVELPGLSQPDCASWPTVIQALADNFVVRELEDWSFVINHIAPMHDVCVTALRQ